MANSNNVANGHQAEPSDTFDPLAKAEALKTALQESLNRATRLIAELRQFHKQHKAVASAMASLRQFQLTT
jgi:Tfp pilus assembly protein PilN